MIKRAIRTGAEICLFLKQQPHTQYLPVVLVSAERDIAEIAGATGADGFIKKPFDIKHVSDKVKSLLN